MEKAKPPQSAKKPKMVDDGEVIQIKRCARLHSHDAGCNYEAKSRYCTFANSRPTPCPERATHLLFARCFCCASRMQSEELLSFCPFWPFSSLFVTRCVCFPNEASFFHAKW